MRVIAAGRVRLEPQTATHAEEMFALLSDPAIYEYENEPPPSLEWLRNRFKKLESRRSADGYEQWLNWVVRLESNEAIGYVQATVFADQRAAIAYEFASAYWRQGYGFAATQAMIFELVQRHGVKSLFAVLKQRNIRSQRLLERLGFTLASANELASHRVDADEILMLRSVAPA